MNYNLRQLVTTIDKDDGKLLNTLIQLKVVNLNDTVKEVLETKSARHIYNFAYYIKRSPKKELAKALIATKNAEYIFMFARYIKGAPIKELADALITTKNAEYIYMFACNIKGAPIKELAEAIIATNNYEYIYYFADVVEGASAYINKSAAQTKYMDSTSIYEADISTLTDEEKLNYLIKLYQKNDFETIRNNRELFKELFEETQGLSRK